ncbi:MAG: hydantoinase/oxoprolinase family protein [Thermoanaerobacteraceae bacterium]|nr:hydantoinase/oxoprolinase family protein [Thermoanaerobacteraceae bacterium]
MFIGLDMGGTHTDAVLISGGEVVRHVKVLTDPADFLASVREALDNLLEGLDPAAVRRINLSTTVCTNAIVEGKTEPVGLLLEPGPGLNPSFLTCAKVNVILQGSIDHRGRETSPLKAEELEAARRQFEAAGIRCLAAVGKFSVRNPAHELEIAKRLEGSYDFITLGHRLSGRLAFPRRVYTAYLNSSVWRVYSRFAGAVRSYAESRGLKIEPFILKADGGTLTLASAVNTPVETILSGPAASIMGALALAPGEDDCVILDIGGTTTDVAFCAGGVPLFEPQGIRLGPYPTLVRSFFVHSVGLGGDSSVKTADGRIIIGPQRQGPPAALGGPAPTPTDALITLDMLQLGDRGRAEGAMETLGRPLGLSVREVAQSILREFAASIARTVDGLLNYLNSQPVYTIREVLAGKKLDPRRVIAVGAPVPLLKPFLEEASGLPVEVPPLAGVANAVGAALSHPTATLALFADTERGVLTAPEIGWQERINRSFSLEEARRRAFALLEQHLRELGYTEGVPEMEVIEEQSFNMVRGFYTVGRNIRLKVQNRPSLGGLKGGSYRHA